MEFLFWFLTITASIVVGEILATWVMAQMWGSDDNEGEV